MNKSVQKENENIIVVIM